ncbi:hypothetical protein [Agarivorans sp. 1_MG-2023]|uniref:hypothetical protein n=1 Tax=Agarivorans sp. 1_MG-2023 TaxID=3062634 RepID=UPI0026E167E1|nr:hypothetical protein [Agarivorans sp. 1_MG-2023]MDO6763025.1 hypothetical protein [Agarivorans sp. 1_MG-2023]
MSKLMFGAAKAYTQIRLFLSSAMILASLLDASFANHFIQPVVDVVTVLYEKRLNLLLATVDNRVGDGFESNLPIINAMLLLSLFEVTD